MLQVRFNALSTVVRVAIKGNFHRVTQYRLAYSEDCAIFIILLDGAGNNVVINQKYINSFTNIKHIIYMNDCVD